MLVSEIQNVIQLFANLLVAGATGLCFVIAASGVLQQPLKPQGASCKIGSSILARANADVPSAVSSAGPIIGRFHLSAKPRHEESFAAMASRD